MNKYTHRRMFLFINYVYPCRLAQRGQQKNTNIPHFTNICACSGAKLFGCRIAACTCDVNNAIHAALRAGDYSPLRHQISWYTNTNGDDTHTSRTNWILQWPQNCQIEISFCDVRISSSVYRSPNRTIFSILNFLFNWNLDTSCVLKSIKTLGISGYTSWLQISGFFVHRKSEQ